MILFIAKMNKIRATPTQPVVAVTGPVSPTIPQPVVPPPVTPPAILKLVPKFENYPPIRGSGLESLGKVLGDIESHMPAGHIYVDNDKITWAHETTHGINSNARMKFSRNGRINAFYVLENRVVVIQEPNTTIRNVAANVPESLRGGVYNLYLVQQAAAWNDTPLYIFDEWSAYVNGSDCRLDLDIYNRHETVQYMLEFNVYATCVAMTSKSDDQQLKSFLMWEIERAMKIYEKSINVGGSITLRAAYIDQMRTSPDAAQWRVFCQQYYGADWCKEVLGF